MLTVYDAPPDLVLMDADAEGRWVRGVSGDQAGSERLIPVVLVTSLDDTASRIRGIEAGADDFVSKPFSPPELLARVRSLLCIKRYTDDFDSAEKVGIPDAVLPKLEQLAYEEYEPMKQHAIVGDRLCGELRSLRKVRPIVRHHHERLDGGGYQDGLRDDVIPLLAQIMGMLDVFDALMTERPYKSALPFAQAPEELRGEAARAGAARISSPRFSTKSRVAD